VKKNDGEGKRTDGSVQYMEHINTLCGQNVELLSVKLVVHNDHCAVHIVTTVRCI
jgi:hypothetical protein